MKYREIVQLRQQAEATAESESYERVAAEFEALGMYAAAMRCRERARYYRVMYGPNPTSVPCVQPVAAQVVE